MYGVKAWPTLLLIDPLGKAIGYISGEGIYELFDALISKVIKTFDAKGLINRQPLQLDLEGHYAPLTVLSFPGKVIAHEASKQLFIADSNHNRIVVASIPDGEVKEVIGSGEMGLEDEDFSKSSFNHPQGMAFDGNNLYVADTENHAIRMVDLDKPDITLVRDTFFNHSRAFTDLNTRIIFAVNSFIINSPEAGLLQGQMDTHILPMIKINNKDGTPCDEGRDLLEKILDRRLEKGLIEEDALGEAIEKSGGVLRDFFEIIEIAATSARHNRLSRIGKEQIRYACAKVKSDYNRKIKGNNEEPGRISTAQLYEKLLTIARSDRKVFAQDDPMAILLGSQAVLEYNGDQWFDIHPLVRELLKDMGKL